MIITATAKQIKQGAWVREFGSPDQFRQVFGRVSGRHGCQLLLVDGKKLGWHGWSYKYEVQTDGVDAFSSLFR